MKNSVKSIAAPPEQFFVYRAGERNIIDVHQLFHPNRHHTGKPVPNHRSLLIASPIKTNFALGQTKIYVPINLLQGVQTHPIDCVAD